MHGGEGPPHDSDSYRGDSAPHGQEEAPPQKALNFVFTPFMKKQSTRLMKKKLMSKNPLNYCQISLTLSSWYKSKEFFQGK